MKTSASILVILTASLVLSSSRSASVAAVQSKRRHRLASTRQANLDNKLFEAVDKGDIAKVRSLLDRGASPNASQPSVPGDINSRSHLPKPGEYTGEDVGD